jgi:arylsulfate sulfotransferase
MACALKLALLTSAAIGAFPALALAAHTVTFSTQTQGPTPFIEVLRVDVTGAKQLSSVQFTITPKPGSYTRPISATYSAAYMIAHGYWSGDRNVMRIPVFGTYSGYTNNVTFTFSFADTAPVIQDVPVTTAAYTDSCNVLNNRTVIVSNRQATSDLSFDYFLLKKYCDKTNPTILDTDGEVRFTGDNHVAAFSSTFFDNAFYITDGKTGINRMDFDGTLTHIGDYANIGVTLTNHHNFDLGKTGVVMEVNTTTQFEATNLEVDAMGNVLNEWDFGKIISNAMIAGGDDPSGFVLAFPTDWFHNNATTYNPADNTLIVSSRENFVIAVDYDTQQIKWILGDHTKHWYQYKSLRKFALSMPNGTRPPIGQHAISIDDSGNLLLHDDGFKSQTQVPAGKQRGFTSARAYHIDTTAMTATEVFTYAQHGEIYDPICGSTYEDAPKNYMIDYATADNETIMELVGLAPGKKKIFDYQYPAVNYCSSGWNAEIIHLDNLQFN